MKVQIKQFEYWCMQYSERWNKKQLWDSFILVKDAWLNGYYKAREEAYKKFETAWNNPNYAGLPIETGLHILSSSVEKMGEEQVETEIGSPQIGEGLPVFTKYQFKKQMQACYDCNDIRIDVTNGLVSFQGTFRINND